MSSRAAWVGDDTLHVECGPLPPALVEQWVSPHLTDKRARELVRQSGGSPRRIEQLLAEALGASSSSKLSPQAAANGGVF